jgi:hypothetical protein
MEMEKIEDYQDVVFKCPKCKIEIEEERDEE